MKLDPKICEKARRSRDARFDGRFFVGVVSTGVYCRPVCPAPAANSANVVYFRTAAAAAQAGLRPCLRCRPESSPGTPSWLGTSSTVTRALALIESGALDDGSVEDLAGRLGLTSRHLSRLFREHLGAPPVAIAQTRRLLFAKKLLNETDLQMADIAFASGFGSVRRFNHLVSTVYGRPPSDLRPAARPDAEKAPLEHSAEALVLELPFREPFDWHALVAFLEPRALPGVEEVDAASYRRSFAVTGAGRGGGGGDDDEGLLEVRPRSDRACLELRLFLTTSRSLLQIVSRTRRLFDLTADPTEINAVLGRDPLLGNRVRARPGVRIPGAWDGFELAVRAILGQQVTVAAATTLAGRLVERFGMPLQKRGRETVRYLFPTAASLAEGDLERIGLPRTRAAAIRHLATAVLDGVIDFNPAASVEESVRRLTRIPGIGDWTAQYVALRALGEPDAFPASDLGLRKAVGSDERPLSPAALRRRSASWRPWRGYAAMHLWTPQTDSGQTRRKRPKGARSPR